MSFYQMEHVLHKIFIYGWTLGLQLEKNTHKHTYSLKYRKY